MTRVPTRLGLGLLLLLFVASSVACAPSNPLDSKSIALTRWFLTPGQWEQPLWGTWRYSLPVKMVYPNRFEVTVCDQGGTCLCLTALLDPLSFKGVVRTSHFDIISGQWGYDDLPDPATIEALAEAFRDDIGDDLWGALAFRGIIKWYWLSVTVLEPASRYLGKLAKWAIAVTRDPANAPRKSWGQIHEAIVDFVIDGVDYRAILLPSWFLLVFGILRLLGRRRPSDLPVPSLPRPYANGVLGRLVEGKRLFVLSAVVIGVGAFVRAIMVLAPIPNGSIVGTYERMLLVPDMYHVVDIKQLLHPPLYGYLDHIVGMLLPAPASVGGWQFYVPSLIVGVASIPVLASAAMHLFQSRSAYLVAAFMVSLTVLDIELVEIDDVYATSQLSLAILLWAYSRARVTASRADRLRLTLGFALMIWSSYASSMSLVMVIPVLLVDRVSALRVRQWILVLAGATVAVAPLVPLVIKGMTSMLEMSGTIGPDALGELAEVIGTVRYDIVPLSVFEALAVAVNGFPDSSWSTLHLWLLLPIVGIVLWSAVQRPQRVTLGLVVIVIGAAIVLALASRVMRVGTWNLVGLTYFFTLAVAGTVAQAPPRLAKVLLILVVCYYVLGFLVTVVYEKNVLFASKISFWYHWADFLHLGGA